MAQVYCINNDKVLHANGSLCLHRPQALRWEMTAGSPRLHQCCLAKEQLLSKAAEACLRAVIGEQVFRHGYSPLQLLEGPNSKCSVPSCGEGSTARQ